MCVCVHGKHIIAPHGRVGKGEKNEWIEVTVNVWLMITLKWIENITQQMIISYMCRFIHQLTKQYIKNTRRSSSRLKIY